MPPLFRRPDSYSDRLFFGLRGCMKSGTNWACNLLNLHPQISCVGEYHWEQLLQPLHANLAQRTMLKRKNAVERIKHRIDRVILNTMLDLADDEAVCIGDRTPGAIEPFFVRDARYICIIRDGRDVLVSRAFHLLNRPDRTQHFQDDVVMRELLRKFQNDSEYFERHPDQLLRSEKFVRQSGRMWSQVLTSSRATIEAHPDLAALEVRYEELHRDVEAGRQEMYRFLGVDPSLAAPLDELTSAGITEKRSTSLYRRGEVGDWARHWDKEVDRWFREEAGECLDSFGYC